MKMPKTVKTAFAFFLLLLVSPSEGFTQDPDAGDYKINTQLWLDYYNYYFINRKWQVYGNLGYNMLLDDGAMDEFYIDPVIRFMGRKWYEIHGGISVHYTFHKDTVNLFELRPHQSLRLNWPTFRRIWFSNTFRFEERCVYPVDTWKIQFNLRFRYDLSMTVKIYSWNLNYLYMPVNIEFFFNLGQKLSETFSNRSRWSLGLGYRWKEKWAVECRFAWQRSRAGADKDFQTNDYLIQLKVRQYLFSKKYNRVIGPDHE